MDLFGGFKNYHYICMSKKLVVIHSVQFLIRLGVFG